MKLRSKLAAVAMAAGAVTALSLSGGVANASPAVHTVAKPATAGPWVYGVQIHYTPEGGNGCVEYSNTAALTPLGAAGCDDVEQENFAVRQISPGCVEFAFPTAGIAIGFSGGEWKLEHANDATTYQCTNGTWFENGVSWNDLYSTQANPAVVMGPASCAFTCILSDPTNIAQVYSVRWPQS